MSVLGWILFGFVIGLLARAAIPGKDPLGVIGICVLGIIGAVLGAWIGMLLKLYRPDQNGSFVGATLGAVAILAIYYLISGLSTYRNRGSRGSRASIRPAKQPPTKPTDTSRPGRAA